MTPERAREIVAAINGLAYLTAGITEVKVPSLKGTTLAEMLEAKTLLEAENKAAEARQRAEGGSMSISMVPDDRLIAAAYVLQHFPPSQEPILLVPRPTFNGTHVAVAVVALTPEDDEEDPNGRTYDDSMRSKP